MSFIFMDHAAGEMGKIEANSLCEAYAKILGNLLIDVMAESDFKKQYPEHSAEIE